jgi:hypothetical protein
LILYGSVIRGLPPEGWFDDLDEEEIESIERGRKDHKKGRTPDSRTFWEKHAP